MSSHMPRKLWPSAVAAAVVAAAVVGGCAAGETSDNLVDHDGGAHPSSPASPRPTPTPAPTPVAAGPSVSTDTTTLATADGQAVTRGELDDWLYRSYGINILGDLIELKLAQRELAKAHLPPVTDAEVKDERQRSFQKMFEGAQPSDYEQYYKQLLQQKHLTEAEFDLGFRTTAVLRKLVRPQILNQVSDKALRQAFGILYGENRRIADIAVNNLADASKAYAELAAGKPFPQVVREMSQDVRTKQSGGIWPAFSAETPTVPKVIMDATFALAHEGDLDPEPLLDGNRYHIVKLLQVIPPKLVKYEDVKEDVRRQVADQLEQSGINQYRQVLNRVAVASLHIEDPTLRHQWDLMATAQRPRGTLSPAEVARREPPPSATPAATRPAAAPMGPAGH